MCANFQLKPASLTFLAKICPKRKLGFEIQKTNAGIKMTTYAIPRVPIFGQNRQLWLFGPKFPQRWILGSKFRKSKSRFGISILEILGVPISDKFLGPNLPKNGFQSRNFKNLSPDSESALLRSMCANVHNSDFFCPNFTKKEIRIWNSEN